ncbi:hypothetical protein [Algoriphagus namhaensis]
MRHIKTKLSLLSYSFDDEDLNPQSESEMVYVFKKYQPLIEESNGKIEALNMEKEKLIPTWETFVNSLKNEVQFKRVVDRSVLSHTYSYRVEIGLENGFGFCMSFISKVLGIYYSSNNLNSSVTIKEYSIIPGVLDREITHQNLSYFPFARHQLDTAKRLISLNNFFFPNFDLFDNTFANEEYRNLGMGEEKFFKCDLFQILFANNLVVI